MAGLVPAIHALEADKDVDARVKPAHDGQTFAHPPRNDVENDNGEINR
jgi:hypothetical protein